MYSVALFVDTISSVSNISQALLALEQDPYHRKHAQRSGRIEFRLSVKEHDLLNAISSADGVRRTDVLRKLIVEEAKRRASGTTQ